MSKLPQITSKAIISVLRRKGFYPVHSRGSHQSFHSPEGRTATVPCHSGKILKPKTLKSILEQAGITVEELIGLL